MGLAGGRRENDRSIEMPRKVLMLLSNPATYDVRPLRIAKSLARNGFSVLVLGWDRENVAGGDSCLATGVVVKRFRLGSRYGQHMSVIFRFFLYYLWCVINAFALGFEFIHCNDVDTLPCGLLLKSFSGGRARLVYDMHDHPEVFLCDFPFSPIMIKFLLVASKRYADLILVVNEAFSKYLSNLGFSRESVITVMNAPPINPSGTLAHSTRGKKFQVVYYGQVSEERGVHTLVEAIRDLPDVTLLVAGRGPGRRGDQGLVDWVKSQQHDDSNVRYLGWLAPSELEELLDQADLIPSIYVPDTMNNFFATPGKLLLALSKGMPALVPAGSYQAELVKRLGCGVVTDPRDAQNVRECIQMLASNIRYYAKLGKKAREAHQKEINWTVMEKRLLVGYRRLELLS